MTTPRGHREENGDKKSRHKDGRKGRVAGTPLTPAKLRVLADENLAPFVERLHAAIRAMEAKPDQEVVAVGLASACRGIDFLESFVTNVEHALDRSRRPSAREQLLGPD